MVNSIDNKKQTNLVCYSLEISSKRLANYEIVRIRCWNSKISWVLANQGIKYFQYFETDIFRQNEKAYHTIKFSSKKL